LPTFPINRLLTFGGATVLSTPVDKSGSIAEYQSYQLFSTVDNVSTMSDNSQMQVFLIFLSTNSHFIIIIIKI
jgi:DNA-binding MurR/RpiR family transcriptional regulator